MQEHILLESDILSQTAPVVGLEWAPPGLELYLLAITAGGEILLWRHGALNAFVSSPLSLRDWHLDHVRQLPSSPGRRTANLTAKSQLLLRCCSNYTQDIKESLALLIVYSTSSSALSRPRGWLAHALM